MTITVSDVRVDVQTYQQLIAQLYYTRMGSEPATTRRELFCYPSTVYFVTLISPHLLFLNQTLTRASVRLVHIAISSRVDISG